MVTTLLEEDRAEARGGQWGWGGGSSPPESPSISPEPCPSTGDTDSQDWVIWMLAGHWLAIKMVPTQVHSLLPLPNLSDPNRARMKMSLKVRPQRHNVRTKSRLKTRSDSFLRSIENLRPQEAATYLNSIPKSKTTVTVAFCEVGESRSCEAGDFVVL